MYTIPVLVVSYFPLNSKGWIDTTVATDVYASYETIKQHTLITTQQLSEVLQRGSRFRAYRNPQAVPSLRYEIVGAIEYLEPLPLSDKLGRSGQPFPDYFAIMRRIDIEHWLRQYQVAEVWLWAYHGDGIDLWESNMSGPWGDISNSDCDPADLPLLDRTYTVYHYNYQRGLSEALEDHLHQIEAVLRYVDTELFWNHFVGATGAGRCGWSHIPPNAREDYDWSNRRYSWTDIEDWRPDGTGERTWLNCERWGGNSVDWFAYWMQSIPGLNNGLYHRGRELTNWWRFIGEFDAAMQEGLGLVG